MAKGAGLHQRHTRCLDRWSSLDSADAIWYTSTLSEEAGAGAEGKLLPLDKLFN